MINEYPIFVISYNRAKNMLHWEPKVSLSDGLDKTIEYFKEKL